MTTLTMHARVQLNRSSGSSDWYETIISVWWLHYGITGSQLTNFAHGHRHCGWIERSGLKPGPARPSKTRPAQPNYRPRPAGLGRQIFALPPKIRPGPARCYLIPLSSAWHDPLQPAQTAAGPLMYTVKLHKRRVPNNRRVWNKRPGLLEIQSYQSASHTIVTS